MARFSRKTLLIGGGLAVVIGVGVWFFQQRPLTVTTAQPEDNVAIKVFGLGTIEARVLSRIGFKVAGTLTELHADHGDKVNAGQMLARLDNHEQSARLAKASALLQSAEAAVQVAEAASRKSEALVTQRVQTNRRRQALLERQAVSVEAAEDAQHNEAIARADLLVTQSEIATAKAKLDDARAQYEFEKVVLSQHELRAPFQGTVANRARELGTVLAPGEALFTVVAPETVWILAYIDEARAGDVREGQEAEIRLRSLPQQSFNGKVARIGIESDRVNEERRVYVTCETCPVAFFLGEQAEVYITTAKLARGIFVPESAIEQFDGRHGTVWIVVDGELRRQRLSFGRRRLDGLIEVTGGIPEKAAVVTSAPAGAREGRVARIAEAPRQ